MIQLFEKIKFDNKSDRIGPDLPFSHWKLHFRAAMTKYCRKKFKFFGKNSQFRPNAYAICCSRISIGDNVVIRPNSMFFAANVDEEEIGNIIIEENALIGSGVHIYTANHQFLDNSKDIIFQGHSLAKNTIIRKGAWIGANAIILPGVEIGENSVVGAGSIVTKNVNSRTVVAGNPAKIIKEIV